MKTIQFATIFLLLNSWTLSLSAKDLEVIFKDNKTPQGQWLNCSGSGKFAIKEKNGLKLAVWECPNGPKQHAYFNFNKHQSIAADKIKSAKFIEVLIKARTKGNYSFSGSWRLENNNFGEPSKISTVIGPDKWTTVKIPLPSLEKEGLITGIRFISYNPGLFRIKSITISK